jgi:adenylosuccinate lyase
MPTDAIDALSPLDGRYARKLGAVRVIFSEAGLIRERTRVECAWLLALAEGPARKALAKLPQGARDWLKSLSADPSATDTAAIKAIEARTNHDVKAVEYWIREQLRERGAADAHLEWVHFACTSEDINNLAYALLLQRARAHIIFPQLRHVIAALDTMAGAYAGVAMVGRTHGQIATPTTVGKELANVAARIERQLKIFEQVAILGKMNGAVGNFNAHVAALPEVKWTDISAAFITSLGLECNTHTTQIEPHDWMAEYCHALIRINTILTDFARDMWSYISIGYFRQQAVAGEVGSSTMPHKINPIDFENAEGNFGVASALLAHFAEKLPISRWQRDLTDSTVQRNIGVAIGHTTLAYGALMHGLGKIELDAVRVRADLDGAWELLGEAVQTVMRAHGVPDGYDKLKAATRGKPVDRAGLHAFIESLDLPEAEKKRLLLLEPSTYLGLAAQLARRKT